MIKFKVWGKFKGSLFTILAVATIYLLISLFFSNHFYFNTKINGVDVSLMPHNKVHKVFTDYSKNYKLKIIERDNSSEIIYGEEIGFKYNRRNGTYKIPYMQHPLKWISSLFKNYDYVFEDIFTYDLESLHNKLNQLNCLNGEIIPPKDVGFFYYGNSYKLIKEVYGNKVDEGKLVNQLKRALSLGEGELNLDEKNCYINPRFRLDSPKTKETLVLLNKYVSTSIIYTFGDKQEVLDGSTIHQWLEVDKNLDVIIDKKKVKDYLRYLSNKYNTASKTRKFKSSIGKIVEVPPGVYGWIIDGASETLKLINHIKRGDRVTKEPAFAQRALEWGENDIGDTYVEINITRQHMWFYKDGKLLVESPIVSGNPNRGNATVLGVYPLIYKQKNAILRGEDYETPVTYWMPFFGNIGIHDATWRSSFGGDIYLRNGSHGCVNAPKHIAKVIFENIESGIPIVCYKE